MIHRPRAAVALLAVVLLAAASPAASLAADAAGPDTVAETPLDTNLLRNHDFESVHRDGTIPAWTVHGDVHVEKFGTKAWPYPAYGAKYDGGKRYLTCGKGAGSVTQTVDLVGRADRKPHVKARLMTNFGGTVGHRIRISVTVTGSSPDAYAEKYKVMDITDHYKVAVTSVPLPEGAAHVVARIELMPKSGSSSCKMVADTAQLILMAV